MRLEVCVGDGDPPQLNYLWGGHAPVVVASMDGLIITDIETSPYKRWQKSDPVLMPCLFCYGNTLSFKLMGWLHKLTFIRKRSFT